MSYVHVSSDLYKEFEKAAKKDMECEIIYLDKRSEITLNSKIVDLKNINNSEFMETEDGTVIRLDRIVEFNGLETSELNHY